MLRKLVITAATVFVLIGCLFSAHMIPTWFPPSAVSIVEKQATCGDEPTEATGLSDGFIDFINESRNYNENAKVIIEQVGSEVDVFSNMLHIIMKNMDSSDYRKAPLKAVVAEIDRFNLMAFNNYRQAFLRLFKAEVYLNKLSVCNDEEEINVLKMLVAKNYREATDFMRAAIDDLRNAAKCGFKVKEIMETFNIVAGD